MRFMILTLLLAALAVPAAGQTPVEYGPSIDLAAARKVMEAAQQEAEKHDWPVAIAIVDGSGFLVMFHRLDNTQLGSVEVALQKAKTAALFRRPTKVFEDLIAEGGRSLKLLSLPGGLPMEGGLPIIVDGKLVGGIGVSGVMSTQDAQVATAGLKAIGAAAN